MNKNNGLNGKVRKYPIVTTWIAGVAVLVPIIAFGFSFSAKQGATEERVKNQAQQIEELKKTQEEVSDLNAQLQRIDERTLSTQRNIVDNKRTLERILRRLDRVTIMEPGP